MPLLIDEVYSTKRGLAAQILHRCEGCVPVYIGYITLLDGDQIPANWDEKGQYVSRMLAGPRYSSDEFSLLLTEGEH